MFFYTFALQLHRPYLGDKPDGEHVRSEIICARAAGVDYSHGDTPQDEPMFHRLRSVLRCSRDDLSTASIAYLVRWLKAAKMKQHRYRPATAPLYKYLQGLEAKLLELCT
ncbi:hypothetical protein BZG36_00352 [Bifiguratus adelaidae]|uniref:Uncharacterized protein n=1 Tax=Bifiguratus adelaidae TaxID=1938954 RepID=A0A261Y7S8_9FUNG|nr:hypothetical protein BZG36_00352 [Bifiguratus adelaidae]